MRVRTLRKLPADDGFAADYSAVCAFYLLLYLAQGIIVPYFPSWLNAKGLSVREVGYLLSTTYCLKLICNPIFSHIADVTGRIKGVLVALALTSTVTYALYLLLDGRVLVFFVAITLSLVMPAMYPMADRLAVEAGSQRGFRFGRLRLWGSFGFAMAAVVGGRILIPKFGIGIVVEAVLTILLCTCCIAWHLPDLRSPPCATSHLPLRNLLGRKEYLLVMIAAAFVQSSNGFLYSFSSLYWGQHGISTSEISVFWGVGIGSEILMFFFGAPFVAKDRVLTMLGFAALGSAIRWGGMSLTLNPIGICALQTLQCFTISLNSMAFMQFVSNDVPDELKATAVALYTSVSMGVLLSISVFASRFAVEHGISGFALMLMWACIPIPLIMVGARKFIRITDG